MKFNKTDLQDMVCDENEEVLKKIKDEAVDSTRWSICHDVIFQEVKTGKYYCSVYYVGATEMQYQSAYEYDSDEIECSEVVEKLVEVKQWILKENEDG